MYHSLLSQSLITIFSKLMYSIDLRALCALRVRETIEPFLVTAEQMQAIEGRLFSAGLPVAALMEKVSGLILRWFLAHAVEDRLFAVGTAAENASVSIGVLAGPGHNGGDALVVARELHCLGYSVSVYQPFAKCKPLTHGHASYAKSLGIRFVHSVTELAHCAVIIDGWFGFGLTRPIADSLLSDIEYLNRQKAPVFSIDLPSGIHTDTGQVMGMAIEARYTACLGLWKYAFMQESAIAYCGQSDLIDFDIPLADIEAVLGSSDASLDDSMQTAAKRVRRITSPQAMAALPLRRAPTAHKYKAGHLLLIAGSRQYAGAALLAGLGAMASGVGMLTLAIPESIRLSLLPQLPGALLVGCEETKSGAIAELPPDLDLEEKSEKYDAIALGPGLTTAVPTILDAVFGAPIPLLLDADGLNILASRDPVSLLKERAAPTVLTPHLGEFKRLFSNLYSSLHSGFREKGESFLPGELAWLAAQVSGATVLLKGPRSVIASDQTIWFNPHSTPALARGGSGDVLTGLMGGLMASAAQDKAGQGTFDWLTSAVLGAVWWHSQAAIYASRERTLLGVDPLHLARSLNPALEFVRRSLDNPALLD